MGNKKGRSSKALSSLKDIFQDIGLGSIEVADSPKDARMLAEEYGHFDERKAVPEFAQCGGKNCYPTINCADAVRKRRMRRGAGRLRSYHCPDCGLFHITSQ